VLGAQEMAVPVTFAILTTVATFAPLFFVPGMMGKIWRMIPVIVVATLFFSLLESFFVLPAHLAHSGAAIARGYRDAPKLGWRHPFATVQNWFGRGLERFTEGPYRRLLERTLAYRYTTVAIAGMMFLVALAVVVTGILPFRLFPRPESERVAVVARLPYGAPLERTLQIRDALEKAAHAAIAESGGLSITEGVMTHLGEGAGESGSHVVEVEVQLVPEPERDISSKAFAMAWKERLPEMPGLRALNLDFEAGPHSGTAVDVELSHPNPEILERVSEEVALALRDYSDLRNVENGYAAGKPQLDFHLLDEAQLFGLTSQELARQIRGSIFGVEAIREQRGRNELKVMVRLPKDQRVSEHHLENLQVRLPSGGYVPLDNVARFDRTRAPTAITHEENIRVVNVRAELAPTARSSREVLESLRGEVLPALEANYPGLNYEFAGSQRHQDELFATLKQNFGLALLVVLVLLAIPLRSYVQPLVIMSAIPLGMVGAVAGHLIMGHDLSAISLMGIVALSGVVVNDSLVLVDATNHLRARGFSAYRAIVGGAAKRLRPIFLTSLTTFFGLAPMILETSVQAQFIIPMAISLGFGIVFATVVVLLVVPAVYLVVEDLRVLCLGPRSSSSAPVISPESP
jgi:multidrug efflux pump subunit AcrB